jgi:SRSO17 transposase
VPDDVDFQTKPQIALDQLRDPVAAGLEAEVALVDAGYGTDTDFRDGVTEIGLSYVVGIQSSTSLWRPGEEPLPRKKWGGSGRPISLIRRDAEHQPLSAKQMALSRPRRVWRRVTWHEGTNTKLTSRFAAVRVRPAHCDYHRSAPRPAEWCLIEWPTGEPELTKCFLSTLPANISRRELVNTAKLRWRIERDYQDLKQELGLAHYEGRGWRGFHHYATRCIATSGFLVSEREAIPPSGPKPTLIVKEPPLPESCRPRGPPIRPERHVPNSIPSVRLVVARAIARSISRCPCCQRQIRRFVL